MFLHWLSYEAKLLMMTPFRGELLCWAEVLGFVAFQHVEHCRAQSSLTTTLSSVVSHQTIMQGTIYSIGHPHSI